MNKTLLAAAIAMTATSATAGALSDPIVEPIVIVEDTSSSASHDWLAPAFFLLMLLVATSQTAQIIPTN